MIGIRANLMWDAPPLSIPPLKCPMTLVSQYINDTTIRMYAEDQNGLNSCICELSLGAIKVAHRLGKEAAIAIRMVDIAKSNVELEETK